MQNPVKVSFVVAMYNVAAYIEECVCSLCKQTLDDIEIIVVDDCSTDNGAEVVMRTVEEYPKRKEQLKLIRHKQNTGVKEVRKDGIYQAKGEYVILIDGDDYVDVKMAELMYAKAKESDADIVLCNNWSCTSEGNLFCPTLPEDISFDSDSIREASLNMEVCPTVWCRMIKRGLLVDDRMVWPVAAMAEDVVIVLAASYLAKRYAYTSEPLYYYRQQPGSITNNQSKDNILRRFSGFVKNNEVVLSFFAENGAQEKYLRGIIEIKMRAKNELLPLFPSCKYRKMWMKTYPEMNRVMLLGNSIYKSTFREKLWFFAQVLGLYPRFSRILLSKRLKPEPIWRWNAYR